MRDICADGSIKVVLLQTYMQNITSGLCSHPFFLFSYQVLSDRDRLVKRTQLNRSNELPIGEAHPAVSLLSLAKYLHCPVCLSCLSLLSILMFFQLFVLVLSLP